jgi:hypothetical protein
MDRDICIYPNVVLNVVLPVIIGSYYVLNFKTQKQYDAFFNHNIILYFATIVLLLYGFTKIKLQQLA